MSLARLDASQLADIHAMYQSLLGDPDTDENDRLVAQARCKELQEALDRRWFLTSSQSNGNGKGRNRWPHVDLVSLIQESGCHLRDVGGGKLKGDHTNKHGSRSGDCLVIWTNDGRYWCASCREGGDSAAWLASSEGISYRQAAHRLRQRFGLAQNKRFYRQEVVIRVI